MRDLIVSIFGSYIPLVDASGSPVPGLAGVDWEYVAGIAVFCITLYCVLRIVEAVIRK